MYEAFYGLRENPFHVTPDPRYLYMTERVQEALVCLHYGVENRKGFILLTGEVGTGKTTLLNKLLESLRQQGVAAASIVNSRFNTTQLFQCILRGFGLPTEPRVKSQMLLRLNQWLLERYKAGGTTVLILDEAQNLSLELLEEVRLLTNLETSTEKLLQIVLSGQPELEHKLTQPQLRQLRQRITLRSKTYPLQPEETPNYVRERLRQAGGDGREIFTPEAVEAVHQYAKGIPRLVNLFCEHALISGFADHKPVIGADTIHELAQEFEFDGFGPSRPWVGNPPRERQGQNPSLPGGDWMRRLRRSE